MFGSSFVPSVGFFKQNYGQFMPMTSFSLSRGRYPFFPESILGAGGSCRVFPTLRGWILLGVWVWNVGFDLTAWAVCAEIIKEATKVFGSRNTVASESIIF